MILFIHAFAFAILSAVFCSVGAQHLQ